MEQGANSKELEGGEREMSMHATMHLEGNAEVLVDWQQGKWAVIKSEDGSCMNIHGNLDQLKHIAQEILRQVEALENQKEAVA